MIGVAFVGTGLVSEMHGRAVAANRQTRLVGVYDPKTRNADAVAKKFGGSAFRSLKKLLADRRVDAVHVLTPPENHVEVALECLKAKKHVLVEKPVAVKISDIRKLDKASRKSGCVCMPAHNYIYAPAIQRAKRLIEGGKLGKIGSLWVLYNIFTPENIAANYGGILRAVCTHHAYSLLYLLGKPRTVRAAASSVHYKKLTCEDQAMITCEMPNGAIANLWASFATKDLTNDPWTVMYKVLGTGGGISYSWNEAQFEDDRGPGWGFPCYEEGFVNEVNHFVNHAILAGEPPLSTLSDAADTLQIIEAAELSIREKSVVDITQ